MQDRLLHRMSVMLLRFPAFPALIPVEFKTDILAFPLFKGV
jgi:hypothetical protein